VRGSGSFISGSHLPPQLQTLVLRLLRSSALRRWDGRSYSLFALTRENNQVVYRRWVFSLSAAVSGFSPLLCLAMKESRPSTILQRDIRAIARSSGFDGLFYESIENVASFGAFCEPSLILPMRLFCTEPIVLLASTMAATVRAIIYVLPEAFSVVFADVFGFSPRQCSLVNLATPVGVLFTFLPRSITLDPHHLTRAS
jgi:hypothetical protein